MLLKWPMTSQFWKKVNCSGREKNLYDRFDEKIGLKVKMGQFFKKIIHLRQLEAVLPSNYIFTIKQLSWKKQTKLDKAFRFFLICDHLKGGRNWKRNAFRHEEIEICSRNYVTSKSFYFLNHRQCFWEKKKTIQHVMLTYKFLLVFILGPTFRKK